MLERAMRLQGVQCKTRLTVKMAVSAMIVLLAIALPQWVHALAGAQGGMTWLPMYLPVLIGGCILGKWWGLGIGLFSPALSFLLTTLSQTPMPTAQRLPFMMAELAVFAFITGMFSEKIAEKPWLAFPAVLLAQCSGRALFLLLTALYTPFTTLDVALVFQQILQGSKGLLVQAIVVPVIVIALQRLFKKEEGKNEGNLSN